MLSQTINLNRTFTDINPGIKKNHNLIKTVATKKKTKKAPKSIINFLKTSFEVRNTCRSKK